VVSWMFAQRLGGHSAARIARALNDAGIPCPSAADPGRNRHRSGASWTVRTVTTILSNPRYTGRQVWNRQRTDKDLADPADVSLGHKSVQRWNLPVGWVISDRPAHPALVSEGDFIAAQDVSAARGPAPEGDPAGPRSAVPPDPGRPGNAYVREDRVRPRLAALYLLLNEAPPAVGQEADPPRRRRGAAGQSGGRDRVPARARDHPDLRSGRGSPARRHRRNRQDHHGEGELTPAEKARTERRRTERRPPGAGGSLRPG